MASVENSVRALLLANPTLAGLVSTRIYPDYAPLNAALPHIVAEVISDVPDVTHEGEQGYTFVRMQYTISASSYSSLQAVHNALRAAAKTVNRITQSGVLIAYVRYLNAVTVELTPEEQQVTPFKRLLDFRVPYLLL